VGICDFAFTLYFPQLFFMKAICFPTGFRFLMCHGIYLDYIVTVFFQARTLSKNLLQIDFDVKVMSFPKIHKTRSSISGLFMVTAMIAKVT